MTLATRLRSGEMTATGDAWVLLAACRLPRRRSACAGDLFLRHIHRCR